MSPLCVLDFYVHESKQRCGYGKALFEPMLKVSCFIIIAAQERSLILISQAENLKPFEIAIDRPSPKFLGLLKKNTINFNHIMLDRYYIVSRCDVMQL